MAQKVFATDKRETVHDTEWQVIFGQQLWYDVIEQALFTCAWNLT